MSKVGNLRAMFESGNKGDGSPPERGRSPGLSAGTESPRPLSKIRTNFVAVEKDGRIGLQRDPSSDSVLSKKTVDDTDKTATATSVTSQQSSQDSQPSLADRLQKQAKPSLQMETIPQSPQLPPPSSSQGPVNAPAAGPTAGKTQTPPKEKKNTEPAQSENSTAASKVAKPDQVASSSKAAIERDKSKSSNNGSGVSEPKASKSLSVSTTKTTTSRPAKSPTATKTPTSPTKAVKLPTKTPEKKAQDPHKSATPKAVSKASSSKAATTGVSGGTVSKAATKTASVPKKPPVVQISPSSNLDRGVGFVKPKPKSPTRPVALPASLTTHTAASATRTGAGRHSISQQSGSYQNLHSSRSPSRSSAAPAGGTLRRQSSTINRPRPSIGPPPKPSAVDHPVTKRDKPVDEGFLARMMRPTQASSSRTHEKASTPPRKAPGLSNVIRQPVAAKETVVSTTRKTAVKPDAAIAKKATSSKPDEKKVAQKTAATSTPGQKQKQKTATEDAKREVHKAAAESRIGVKTPEPKFLGLEATEPKTEPKAVETAEPATVPAQSVAEAKDQPPAPVPEETPEIAPSAGLTDDAAKPVDAGVEVMDAAAVEAVPTGSSAAEGSLAETSSEAEHTEPKTPTDATDAPAPAELGESKKIEDGNAADALGLDKSEDGTTTTTTTTS